MRRWSGTPQFAKDPRGEQGRRSLRRRQEMRRFRACLRHSTRLKLTDLRPEMAKHRTAQILPARQRRPIPNRPYPSEQKRRLGAASQRPALRASRLFPALRSRRRPKIIDLSALPDTSLVQLRGREAELARLDAAWADPNIHVLSVVAWGGQGKTALVSTWADRLKAEGGRGAEALLAWSFYSQGSKERAATADRFLDWALKKLGLARPRPQRDVESREDRRGAASAPRAARPRRRRAHAARAGTAGGPAQGPCHARAAAPRRGRGIERRPRPRSRRGSQSRTSSAGRAKRRESSISRSFRTRPALSCSETAR